MKHFSIPMILISGSVAISACDVEPSDVVGGGDDTTNPGDTGADVPAVPLQYTAIIIDDSRIFPTHRADGGNPCATSSMGAHGADIDAVALMDGPDLVGYLDTVDYEAGTRCTMDADFTDSDLVKGAPDGQLLEGFVSLGGGWLTGEFDNQALILPTYDVIVYEVGAEQGGLDEGFELFVAEDLDCVNQQRNECAKRIGEGEGEASFDLRGF